MTTQYKKKRSKATHCFGCGRVISGIAAQEGASGLRHLSRTEKRPQRMFGGQLCNKCLLESLKQTIRRATPE